MNVTNNGTLTADADGWAAGIEAVGGDINLVSNTGADISAYAYAGRATGMFANASGDATVRNGGALDAESYWAMRSARSRRPAETRSSPTAACSTRPRIHGNAFGMVGVGYNADLSQSATITVSGYGTAVGIEGIGYAHANIVNNGDVIVTAVPRPRDGPVHLLRARHAPGQQRHHRRARRQRPRVRHVRLRLRRRRGAQLRGPFDRSVGRQRHRRTACTATARA